MVEKKSYRSKLAYIEIARHYKPSPEMQQLMELTRPETRAHVIQTAKDTIASLPQEVRNNFPTEEEYRRYRLQVGFFLNPITQPRDKSQHNILHGAGTEMLAGAMAEGVNVPPDSAHAPEGYHLNRTALMIAGSLHDSQRILNDVETAVAVDVHAKRGAMKVGTLLKKMGVSVDASTQNLAASMIRYHDTPIGPMDGDPHMQLMKLADNLGMVRFMFHEKRIKGIQNITLQTVQDKLLDFHPKDPLIASLREKYIPVAIALYALGEEKALELKKKEKMWRRIRRDYQFEGMLLAAKELGLVGQAESISSQAS